MRARELAIEPPRKFDLTINLKASFAERLEDPKRNWKVTLKSHTVSLFAGDALSLHPAARTAHLPYG